MTRPSRLLVVSPHLDDAVFGCGELMRRMPGALCVTVFAGLPRDPEMQTDWDRDAGYACALEALACRRGEDAAALRRLGAEAHWLRFTDDQYGERTSATREEVTAALIALIDAHAPDAVAIPFGLFHRDHALAHEAAIAALDARPTRDWLAYEDALYRRLPGLLPARLAALEARGVRAVPWLFLSSEADSPKHGAVRCYGSQLRALARPGGPGHADLLAPEACWRLAAGAARAA
ncbi:MAG: PIG-L family deacetylase [Gammaproteobacteria bacterium]